MTEPGDALKINEGENITIRGVRTEWTTGYATDNGAYGIYPVQTTNVLIEDSVAIGASDAGIYVGQSNNVIVRNNRAEFNVAGRWEKDLAGMKFNYDFWYQPRLNVMVSSEWAAPKTWEMSRLGSAFSCRGVS